MTLFIPKRTIKLIGVLLLVMFVGVIQISFDPIGKYQAVINKRAEELNKRQIALEKQKAQAEKQSEGTQDKAAMKLKQADKGEKSVSKNKKKKSQSSKGEDLLKKVNKAGEHIMVTAKSLKPGFFTEFRLERDRVRDQQLQLLKDIISNAKNNENTKQEAQDKMLQITKNLGKELEVENLIKARDYEDAIVFLQDSSAVVVIKSNKLAEEDKAKIETLVKQATGIKKEEIIIICKK